MEFSLEYLPNNFILFSYKILKSKLQYQIELVLNYDLRTN
ncbi:hypothetical protein HF848_07735 [Clostridium perfringens]|nr:hypothetical protein [Clostridium perfringens]